MGERVSDTYHILVLLLTDWLAENARNLSSQTNIPLTIQHYLNNMALLTNQWNAHNYKDEDRQRIYLKDIDCPAVWHEKLRDMLPPFLFYLNESTASKNMPIANAGDLMSSLPPEMRAENMMCYIGHEGTYTPSHREMCATLGQNIMVEASTGGVEQGKTTKPGSSIWFMTESKDRHIVSEYWRSTLGHDIETEDHFAQINAWKAAPFKTYVIEQRVGDFILIPPLAPHQVWNRGTRTMKAAWNRTTAETLEIALKEALPNARMVCRDEQYKTKATVYFSLSKYSNLLNQIEKRGLRDMKVLQLQRDFKRLFHLYTDILLSESFSQDVPEPKRVEYIPFEGSVVCSYCRGNIFNRFLTCESCVGQQQDEEDDTYDICLECYAIGRSCACISRLKWCEQFRWKDLIYKYETWMNQIIKYENRAGRNPSQTIVPLPVERERRGKKTLAEICQEELKRRPFVDITKPVTTKEGKVSQINGDKTVRKRRKIQRSGKFKKEHGSCHICKNPEPQWQLANCTECGLNYCYGSLFRAFELLPTKVLEEPNWKCPKCQKICSCAACRRDPTIVPFEPMGTALGHDTKKVADPRSVECLVDFSISNVGWLQKANDLPTDQGSRRLRKRQEEAEKDKSNEAELWHIHYPESGEPGKMDLFEQENLSVDQSLAEHAEAASGMSEEEKTPINPNLRILNSLNPRFVFPSNGIFRTEASNKYENTDQITFVCTDSAQSNDPDQAWFEPTNADVSPDMIQPVPDGADISQNQTGLRSNFLVNDENNGTRICDVFSHMENDHDSPAPKKRGRPPKNKSQPSTSFGQKETGDEYRSHKRHKLSAKDKSQSSGLKNRKIEFRQFPADNQLKNEVNEEIESSVLVLNHGGYRPSLLQSDNGNSPKNSAGSNNVLQRSQAINSTTDNTYLQPDPTPNISPERIPTSSLGAQIESFVIPGGESPETSNGLVSNNKGCQNKRKVKYADITPMSQDEKNRLAKEMTMRWVASQGNKNAWMFDS